MRNILSSTAFRSSDNKPNCASITFQNTRSNKLGIQTTFWVLMFSLRAARIMKQYSKQVYHNRLRISPTGYTQSARYWWFVCDVRAAMLVDRNNKIFLLWELTSIFKQTTWTTFLLFCPPTWRQWNPPINDYPFKIIFVNLLSFFQGNSSCFVLSWLLFPRFVL